MRPPLAKMKIKTQAEASKTALPMFLQAAERRVDVSVHARRGGGEWEAVCWCGERGAAPRAAAAARAQPQPAADSQHAQH